MRSYLLILWIFFSIPLIAQNQVQGIIQNKETKEPLAYAKIEFSDGTQILSNIDGSFSFQLKENAINITISYVGFKTVTTKVYPGNTFLQVNLSPNLEQLDTVVINAGPNRATRLITQAIKNKPKNDPEQVLDAFTYNSYSKFIIDNESAGIDFNADSTGTALKTIINDGRSFLSEKVSIHRYTTRDGRKEEITGINTAGFKKPVYEVLSMEIHPLSLYQNKYDLFDTDYAGPLSQNALNNYTYKILDTTETKRPAYVIYFKPKREKIVAGLEGVLYLDVGSLAIQKAKAQLLGVVKLEVIHNYKYLPEVNLWFPTKQSTTIRPGSGGKNIAVFGGSISVGTIQRKRDVLNTIFPSQVIPRDLYLTSVTSNYNIELNKPKKIKNPKAEINLVNQAMERDSTFWETHRKIPFTNRDRATQRKLDTILKKRNIERKITVKKTIAGGHYPVGFWDFDLGKVFKFNNYEGIRLGVGGKTNDKFSEKFNLTGYTTYGFKDEVLKYGIGAEYYLNKRQGTNLKVFYSKDIQETGSFKYLKGERAFSIIEPRFVNINFFYTYRQFWMGMEHDVNPQLKTEFRLGRSDISQTRAYVYKNDNQTYQDYTLTTATASFIWRPFSKYLSTPDKSILVDKEFPQFTGQIEQYFANILDGDFTFTRVGLKVEHEIKRIDQSRTEFILEGDYAFGDYPLTHAFHAYPNNPTRSKILERYSVAGRNSFETMYYNEFFSDRQLMLQLRHQIRPFRITQNIRPELVIISRHVIGDMNNKLKHQQIQFDTLEHGFSEIGLELNKIFSGFGLSFAYRYGAYHLPTFNQNFSFKFTFQLKL